MGNEREVMLEEWRVLPSVSDGYTAPEMSEPRLVGRVYGHPLHDDGKTICVSRPIRFEGGVVTTRSGTRYRIGSPQEEYERLFPGAYERLVKTLQEMVGV